MSTRLNHAILKHVSREIKLVTSAYINDINIKSKDDVIPKELIDLIILFGFWDRFIMTRDYIKFTNNNSVAMIQGVTTR